MIAYKGFRPGLICRGYQFVMGLNTTEKANCRENGFHCAEDPLDCLSYYSSLEHSEYYMIFSRHADDGADSRTGDSGQQSEQKLSLQYSGKKSPLFHHAHTLSKIICCRR